MSLSPAMGNKLTGLVLFGGIIGGAYLGTGFAERLEGEYSPEKVATYNGQIEEIDERVGLVIGEEQVCMRGVYNVLRLDNVFPTDSQEIQKKLDQSCPSEPAIDEEDARIVASYVEDIRVLNGKLVEQDDYREVDFAESFPLAWIGASIGSIGSIGLVAGIRSVDGKFRSRKNNQDQKDISRPA